MEPNSVYNYKDFIFSCFQPDESLIELRLSRHALVYVYYQYGYSPTEVAKAV